MKSLNPYCGAHKHAYYIKFYKLPDTQGYCGMLEWRGSGKKRKPKLR